MVTTRNVKGSPLTFDEMDTNFEGLELSVSSSVAILQSTIQQAVSGITLSTITGTLDPSRIGPFTDAGVTYDTLEDYLIFLSQKAGSGGTGGPTAPVISAAFRLLSTEPLPLRLSAFPTAQASPFRLQPEFPQGLSESSNWRTGPVERLSATRLRSTPSTLLASR